MSRSAMATLAFLAAAVLPLFAAKSSKPKEIVVVGSKIESAPFQMPYRFGPDRSLVAARQSGGGTVATYTFTNAWPSKVSGPNPRSNVELDVASSGQIVGRLPGRLECVSDSPEPAVIKGTLLELGFSRTTPIRVTPRGQGHLLRMGEAVSRNGRCSVSVRLVP